MPAAKNHAAKPAAAITTAAARTRSMIENLEARLKEVTPVLPTDDRAEKLETEEELERQLEAYFARACRTSRSGSEARSRTQILDELRNRVIDGVVDRILEAWSREQQSESANGLSGQVVERLVERVLAEVGTSGLLKADTRL